MRYTWREWAYIGLFGALWALVDTRVGPLLVARDVPFFSGVLAVLGIMLALIGRRFVPRPGSVVLMACFALILKFVYGGGFSSTPVLRILSPALVAEATLVLTLRTGRSSLVPFVVAGALAVFWTLAQSFLFPGIFAPQGLKMVYALTLIGGTKLLQASTLGAPALLTLAAGAHLLCGASAGFIAWAVVQVGRTAAGPAAPGPAVV